jgi:pimeloyl-ACP methyl ester carboxylesterase
MPKFSYDSLEFNYRDEGRGYPFIFQHGLGGDADQTFAFFPPGHPFRLLTLECRGHGETRPLGPEDKLSIATFADDVIELMEELGIERAIVGGISMGAAVALNIALRFPDRCRALILSRPAWEDKPNPPTLHVLTKVAKLIRKHGAQEGLKHFRELPDYNDVLKASPDNIVAIESQFTHPRAEETVAKLERIPADAPNRNRDEWESIVMPVLVLANRQDLIHPFDYAETLARIVPGAILKEVTAKSTSVDRHNDDVRNAIFEFISTITL